MTHIEYNPRASQREIRRATINRAAAKAMNDNQSQFTEGALWAGYVFLFFVVAATAAFAVVSWL